MAPDSSTLAWKILWTEEPVLERHPQLSLATRGEDWASQGQPKGKAEIPVVTRHA